MSALYGIIRFDAKPAVEALQVMARALQPWGLDSDSSLLDANVGFGLALTRSTPEASFEALPKFACLGTVLFTAVARLDNRLELGRALGLDSVQLAVTADGTLVVLAFERWGEACVDHLLGDWAFAVWDKHKQKLFLARDHFGNLGVHYGVWQHGLAFSSGIEGVLELPEFEKKLDLQSIAQWGVAWVGDGTQTCYQDVFRLPPSHTLTWQNHKLEVRRYWRLEDTPPLRLKSNEAYVEVFLETLRLAVHDRMRACRPVASTLSSGLDSGAVTALAAEVSKAHLHAFTSVPIHPLHHPLSSGLLNEWDLAQQTAQWIGTIKHLPIPAGQVSPVAATRQILAILREPSSHAGNMYWILALLQEIQTQGFGVLLTGQLGNFAASWNGGQYPVWSAVRQKQFGLATKQLASGAKGRSSWTRAILGELVKPAILTAQVRWQQLNRRPKNVSKYLKDTMLSPILLHQLNLSDQLRHTPWNAFQPFLYDVRHQFFAGLEAEKTPVGALWSSLGAAYGIEVRDPTMDKRLLEVVASFPLEQFSGQGHTRWLMRRAMQNILPPSVQWNTNRGVQGADLGHRLLELPNEVKQAIAEVTANRQNFRVLNIPLVEQTWAGLLGNPTNPMQMECNKLLLGLSLGFFLNSFSA